MKPCAERQMRGLCSHWQPDTGAPAERGAAAWLSFHPDLPGTAPGWGHLGRGTWAPCCPPSLCWNQRKREEDVSSQTCFHSTGWWSLGILAPSLPTWAGCTQTLQQAADGWICSRPLSQGTWVPLCSFSGTAWRFDTIYGVGVGRQRSGLGKVPAQPLAGESSPGEPPPCPSCTGGVPGSGRELPASYPPASSLRLPPPSPPALLQEEIQQLKSKLEKVEKERNELRLNSDRLESRVGPCRCRDGVWCRASLPQPMAPFPLLPPDHRADVGAHGRAEHRRVGLPAAGRRDGREAAG